MTTSLVAPIRGTEAQAGLNEGRLEAAYELVERWVTQGEVSGAVVAISRQGICLEPRAFGVRRWRQQPIRPMAVEDVFLVASVTKPVTAAALMGQVALGRAQLRDRVVDHLPAFAGDERDRIQLIHLLTHTSGLPDMLPENDQLRTEHAPLSRFVEGVFQTPLLFRAGERVQYQSMGTLLAGEIASRLARCPLPELMSTTLFEPLGMASSILGYGSHLDDRVAAVQLPVGAEDATDWHWNSDYWRHVGSPWGGMHSTAEDLMRWMHLFLRGDAAGILQPGVSEQMIADQLTHFPALNEADDRWGLGWRVGAFGGHGSPRAFSHGGATGTFVGADPDTGLACVLLTTSPGAPLQRLATAIQDAVLS